MDKINVAIIGAGYWGPNLVRNFSLVENCNVKYICDVSEERLKKIKQTFPHVQTTTRFEEVLNDKEVHGIAIATPVRTHYPLAKQALLAQKHVLVEKPMANSSTQCEELIQIAAKNNKLLLVDHTFLYTGAVRKMKELLDKKELGDVYYFDSERINLGLIQDDVNVVWDLAPHDISMMLHFFEQSKPISVFATGTKFITKMVEEMAHITVNFDTGLVGHIHVSWLSPVKIRKILLGGSQKMIVYNDIDPSEKLKIYDRGVSINYESVTPLKPLYRSGDVHIPKLDEKEALLRELEHFIDCIMGKELPLVEGKHGLEVVKILEACDRSMNSGRVEMI